MSMMQIRGNSLEGQYIGGIASNISRTENSGETVLGDTGRTVQQNAESGTKNSSLSECATLEISEEAYRRLAEQFAKSIQEQTAAGLPQEPELLFPIGEPQSHHTYRLFSDFDLQERLNQALKAAPDRETKEALDTAVWDIVDNYLMPRNIGDRTEEERLSLIEAGLKEGEKLLEGLDENAAAALTDFMKGVAKYGREGKAGEDGSVTYDVKNPGWRQVYGQGYWVKANTPELALETMAKEAPEEFQKMIKLLNKSSQKYREGDREEGGRLLVLSEILHLEWLLKHAENNPNSAYLIQQKRATEQIEKAESDSEQADEREEEKKQLALDVSADKMRSVESKQFTRTQAQQMELQKTLYLMKSLENDAGYDRRG